LKVNVIVNNKIKKKKVYNYIGLGQDMSFTDYRNNI